MWVLIVRIITLQGLTFPAGIKQFRQAIFICEVAMHIFILSIYGFVYSALGYFSHTDIRYFHIP